MASYAPVVGHHVIVADKASMYDGREAVVTAIDVIGDVTVYSVKVGNVSFSLQRAKLRESK